MKTILLSIATCLAMCIQATATVALFDWEEFEGYWWSNGLQYAETDNGVTLQSGGRASAHDGFDGPGGANGSAFKGYSWQDVTDGTFTMKLGDLPANFIVLSIDLCGDQNNPVMPAGNLSVKGLLGGIEQWSIDPIEDDIFHTYTMADTGELSLTIDTIVWSAPYDPANPTTMGVWNNKIDNLVVDADPAPAITRYVDLNNTTPVWPYLTWETAATTIHEAVNAAVNGNRILIADGTYNISSEIKFYKSLHIESVNGRHAVTVDAGGNCRVFKIHANNGAVTLKGLTITGGYTDYDYNTGGGISCLGSGPVLISDCMIKDNEAVAHGGGIFLGGTPAAPPVVRISNCILENNTSGGHGGGISSATWKNVLSSVVVKDSIFNGNQCFAHGGGIQALSADGSVVITRCLFTNNSSGHSGGGATTGFGALITDSLFEGNRTTGWTGGAINGTMFGTASTVINCTVVDNEAPAVGGGVSKAIVLNSIVVDNKAPAGPDIGANCIVSNSCSPGLTAGVAGNINEDPLFMNPAAGDFRLYATSPCIDTGNNEVAMDLMDLIWAPRICDGDIDGTPTVDMGAYEFQSKVFVIDIKPGSDSNPINLEPKGRCPVAILTSEEFDTAQVDPYSIRFAGALPVHAVYEDIDLDDDVDLLLHFSTQDLQLEEKATQAFLVAQAHNGDFLIGVDTVTIVPSKK